MSPAFLVTLELISAIGELNAFFSVRRCLSLRCIWDTLTRLGGQIEVFQRDRLILGQSIDTALSDRRAVSRRLYHLNQGEVRQFLEHFPRFLAQPGALAHLRQRLPQHIGQNAHQDVRLDSLLHLVPDWPKLQIGLLDAEGGPGHCQLRVGASEFSRAPDGHIAAQPHLRLVGESPAARTHPSRPDRPPGAAVGPATSDNSPPDQWPWPWPSLWR